MEIAVEDVNRYLARNPARVRFVAAIEDTRLEPELALERAQDLRRRGAQLLIGPQSSAEVAHLKSFVDANDLLLVSPSSTAGTLAIPGDNIFRFTPADSVEGAAISALMWKDGIRAVVPVWRDDAGNAGLEMATRAAFSARSGSVLTSAPPFPRWARRSGRLSKSTGPNRWGSTWPASARWQRSLRVRAPTRCSVPCAGTGAMA